VSILHPVFESLTDVITASEWVYLLIVLIAALDAVFPLVPSEATVVAAALTLVIEGGRRWARRATGLR
jgi:membrane protein DedA with SNARE-associated domain